MDDWTAGNIKHRDFQHSDRPEDWEPAPHKAKARKGCKRNKGGKHNFTKIIKFYGWGETRWYVLECSKCGKHVYSQTSVNPLATNEQKG